MNLLVKKKIETIKRSEETTVYVPVGDTIELVAVTECGDVQQFKGELIYDNGNAWVAAASGKDKILTGHFNEYFNTVHLVDGGIHSHAFLNRAGPDGIRYELRHNGNVINPFVMGYKTFTEEKVIGYAYEPIQVGELLDVGMERPVKIEQILMRQSDVTGQVYTVVIASDDRAVYTAFSYPEVAEMKFYDVTNDGHWVFRVGVKLA